jgi:hypothetical protein
MPVLHVLRVFCDSEGQFGSPLGVVLDGRAIPLERRQPLAAELGFSETVYVDDPDTGQLRIFTPAAELPFAGHPLVGTAWLLSRQLGGPVTQLNPPAGPVPTWTSDDQVWIRAPLAAAPPWRLNHVADATPVDAMTEPSHPDQDADQFWAPGSISSVPGPSLRRTVRSAPGRGMRLRLDAACRTPRSRCHHPARPRISGPSQPGPQRHGRSRWPRRLGPRACRRLATMGPAPRSIYPATAPARDAFRGQAGRRSRHPNAASKGRGLPRVDGRRNSSQDGSRGSNTVPGHALAGWRRQTVELLGAQPPEPRAARTENT